MNQENQTQEQPYQKVGLGLIPNEVVGYKIIPDEHNWTVCIVRKYGVQSKKAGEEYATPLTYCKTLQQAAEWIVSRDARMQTEILGLESAFKAASERAVKAVRDLHASIVDSPLTEKQINHILERETTAK
jgi:hypothetical protein